MKTKIVYISGNEVFDITDIRAAFEEVRSALNLDKTTVLFGVPVDEDDAGFATQSSKTEEIIEKNNPEIIDDELIPEPEKANENFEKTPEIVEETEQNESVINQPAKKRGRPRKEEKIETDPEIQPETVIDDIKESVETTEIPDDNEEKIVPILSVLSTDDEPIVEETQNTPVEIMTEVSAEETKDSVSIEITTAQITDEDEAGLEKLLSAMKPLEEDSIEEQPIEDIVEDTESDTNDISVDATLEQLATEFVENQDKIAAESKSSSRSKIGKLRSILPFKQSKHKDQGLGDLFGWAGIAANDEDFSVPGFFTSAAAKK